MIKSYLKSLQFLTVIPIFFRHPPSARQEKWAVALFPLAGLTLGGLTAGVFWAAHWILPVSPALVLSLSVLCLLSGGLHEDGLADCADGFGAGSDRQRILEIMRDSRIGSFGTLALILSFALKWSLLVGLGPERILSILLFAAVLSRWLVLPAALLVPAARSSGLGYSFLSRVGIWQVLLASALVVIAGAGLFGVSFWLLFPLPILVGSAFLAFCYRRLEGITGDCLGALVILGEISCYAAAAFGSSPP